MKRSYILEDLMLYFDKIEKKGEVVDRKVFCEQLLDHIEYLGFKPPQIVSSHKILGYDFYRLNNHWEKEE